MSRHSTVPVIAAVAVALCTACAEPTIAPVSSSDAGVTYEYGGTDLLAPTTLADAHCGRMGRLANLIDVADVGLWTQRASFECR